MLCEKVEESELKTITPKELPKTICDRICSGNPRYEKNVKKGRNNNYSSSNTKQTSQYT